MTDLTIIDYQSTVMSSINKSSYGEDSINQLEIERPEDELEFPSISRAFNEKINKVLINRKKMDMEYNYEIKNKIKKVIEIETKKDKVRRTSKDKFDRKYICGCGTGYLSYPALYTHIKTKHNSV